MLIIGIDSLEPARFNKVDLPNIRSIGGVKKLKSTIPCSSASAWTSVITGVPPEEHGLYGFVDSQNEPHFSGDIKKETIWEELGKKGEGSLVMNYPLSYPPKAGRNTILVSGLVTPVRVKPTKEEYSQLTNNERVAEILRSNNYIIESGEGTEELEDYFDVIDRRVKSFLDIYKGHEPDFSYLMIGAYDRLTHNPNLANEENLNKLAKYIDRRVGEILKKTEDGRVVVLSDHGTKVFDKKFYINSWLYQNHFLKFKEDEVDRKRSKVFCYFQDHSRFAKVRIKDSRVRAKLISKLERLDFVKRVYLKKEIYGSSPTGDAPDLIVETEDGVVPMVSHNNEVLVEEESYQHSMHGSLITNVEGVPREPRMADIKGLIC